MKVRNLIKHLSKMNQDAVVYLDKHKLDAIEDYNELKDSITLHSNTNIQPEK